MRLVHELSEPLAAIENYLEAAICLNKENTAPARIKLGEIFEMSETEVERAREILCRLRDLMRPERGS